MVTPTIGVLALQGDFIEHLHCLTQCGVKTREVRLPKDIVGLKGLIIPGGESTTMLKLLYRWNLFEAIKQQKDLWLWGTCAGAILLSKTSHLFQQPTLESLEVNIERNAYGSQVASFEENLTLNENLFNKKNCQAVFIRAPRITAVGKEVTILAQRLNNEIVAVQQKRSMITTFHPELTGELCFHDYFVQQCY